MSAEKKSKLSPRIENIAKGIFLILLAVVLALNVGKVGRTLAFPSIYFFGVACYFIYIDMIARGVYRIIKGKRLKIKSPTFIIGVIMLCIGVSFVLGYSLMKQGGYSFSEGIKPNIDYLNGELGRYYQTGFLNLFEKGSHWNTGLIGILISSAIGNDVVILTLGIIFIVLSAFVLSIKPVLYFIKKEKKHKEKPEPAPAKEEPEQAEEEIKPIYVPEPKDETMEVPYGYEIEEEKHDEYFEMNDNSHSLDDIFNAKKLNANEYSEFSKLEFRKKNETISKYEEEKPLEPVGNYNPAFDTAAEEREIANEEMEIPPFDDFYVGEENPAPAPIPPVVTEPQKPAPHVLNEELVRAKPEYEELVAKPNPLFDTPKPVVEEPKKKKERVNWIPPSSDLLETYEVSEAIEANTRAAEERVIAINDVFASFGVGAKCTSYTIGSSVTRFNIEYEANVSMKSVEKLVTDIAVRLGGLIVRFSPIVEGETYSGLEIPNVKTTTVGFKDVFELLPDVKKHPLSVGFGKNISGKVIAADFDEFPHLLVAGTTGSGKSIYTHSIISTLIMRVSPDDLRIVLVDPKRVEMTKYRDMPHLLCPIITEADKAKVMLSKLVDEMNDRYQLFADADDVSNIKQYNEWAKEKGEDPLPYILVVIDEYADLVDNCKEISQPVVSIAQKARAAGIHMLISTQRPSTNIITGVIKGNLPTHVALMTSSSIDSVTIIGEGGAEKLLGRGDMLVQSPLVSRVGVTRLQGCYIQNKEIGRIVGYLKEHYPTNYDENYLDLVDHSKEVANTKIMSGEVEKEADAAEEAKYQSIKEWVMSQQFVSMSKIQRECAVGFNRAGRFFNRLQKEGVVSTEQDGATKGCKVLIHDEFGSYDDVVNSDELTRY